LCTVKLTTQNQSSHNINQVHILLFSTATSLQQQQQQQNYPDLPTSSGPSYRHKQRQLLTESFFVSIPKHTRDITTMCPFKIPTYCVPTTQCHFGKYIDITYEVVIILSINNISIGDNIIKHPHAIRLPLIITTIPYSSTLPPKLQIPFADENNKDIPTFIETNESPLPSPIDHSSAYSPTGIWSPGSPMAPIVQDNDDDVVDGLLLPPMIIQHDASGHLMVPPPASNNTTIRRSMSIHSTGSC
jgi:hypothetical protein